MTLSPHQCDAVSDEITRQPSVYVMGRNERREQEGKYFQDIKGHKDDGLPSLPAGI